MTILPFACLGVGFLLSLTKAAKRLSAVTDEIINITLVVLMLTIGMNIGVNQDIMSRLGRIGIGCAVMALGAILGSVLCVILAERSVLPLDRIRRNLASEKLSLEAEVHVETEEQTKKSPLIYIMPLSIVLGVLTGAFVMPKNWQFILGYTLLGSLGILYIGVGISLGNNRHVFKYVKSLGLRVLFLPLAIFLGSLLGGLAAGFALRIPLGTSVLATAGMSYYSLTGAFMTQMLGTEAGTYGFIVNVMREFFTVLLLPILVRISKGSPIAGGAAGNMDTMLMPITKVVGPELGLVTLITGTVLTFAVPIILPILFGILF